jgi:ATP-dependent DNA helicase RecG
VLVSNSRSEKAKARLEVMRTLHDGYEIAEKDLELRGPGEFFGKRQSGEFRFRIASLVSDMELVNIAKKEASKTFEKEKENFHERIIPLDL